MQNAAGNIDPSEITPGKPCYGKDNTLLGPVDRVQGNQFWVQTDYGEQKFPLSAITGVDGQGLHLNTSADDLTAQTR